MLPSITEVDAYLKQQGLPSGKAVRSRVKEVLERLRFQIALEEKQEEPFAPDGSLRDKSLVLKYVADCLRFKSGSYMRQVINATGVVIHTNLGRAPLAPEILESLLPLLSSYSTVEFDLSEGARGERGQGVLELLTTLSGAEAAVVVNNNAAAVFLMLSALAKGKDVLVSRGELVEIGGSFRIPDIMREAGVRLVEVGTTNRTRVQDYEKAITENTVAIMKVHPSNFVIKGFVEEASIPQLAKLATTQNLLLLHDLGSGSFYHFQNPALQHLNTIQQEVATNADLISFSGDKLLGSVQAGIILGSQTLIQTLRKHPLYRIVRLDKITLALLEASLKAYLEMPSLFQKIPVIQLLEQSQADIKLKAQTVFEQLEPQPSGSWQSKLEATTSFTGGGALPELYLHSYAITLSHQKKTAQSIQEWLRQQAIPIIVRVQNDLVWLDFRTLFEREFSCVITTLNQLLKT
ncbi:L-seryl-tRNA(Sec) selenium transferase [Deltaproteobacteria bacterium TL4]